MSRYHVKFGWGHFVLMTDKELDNHPSILDSHLACPTCWELRTVESVGSIRKEPVRDFVDASEVNQLQSEQPHLSRQDCLYIVTRRLGKKEMLTWKEKRAYMTDDEKTVYSRIRDYNKLGEDSPDTLEYFENLILLEDMYKDAASQLANVSDKDLRENLNDYKYYIEVKNLIGNVQKRLYEALDNIKPDPLTKEELEMLDRIRDVLWSEWADQDDMDRMHDRWTPMQYMAIVWLRTRLKA